MTKWKQLQLRDAGISVIDCDHRTPKAAEKGFPYATIPQMKQGRLDFSDARLISPEDFADWTRKALPIEHDVVLSRRCNPGESAYVTGETQFALGQNLVLLRSDGHSVYPPYLRWLAQGPGWWAQVAKFTNPGAVFDSFKIADIHRFELTIPPLPEQRAIAHILGTLDDKIELNRKTSQTLEEIARALFKSWFVDFDPVRAKAAGRQPVGMDAETAALFPSEFEESELGLIPKGWRVGRLSDICHASRGLSYKGSGLGDDGIPMVNLNSIYEGGGFKEDGLKFYSGAFDSRHMIEPGELFVANTEQGHQRLLIGYSARVPRAAKRPVIFSHHIYRLRPVGLLGIGPGYLNYLLNSDRMHELVAGYSNGTTVNMLPIDGVISPKVAIPPKAISRLFEDVSDSVSSRTEALAIEQRSIGDLRDLLLPHLISGRLASQGQGA